MAMIRRFILWCCVVLGGLFAVEYIGRAMFYSYAWHHILCKATASDDALQQYHRIMILVVLKGFLGVVLFWSALVGALKSKCIDSKTGNQNDAAQPGQPG